MSRSLFAASFFSLVLIIAPFFVVADQEPVVTPPEPPAQSLFPEIVQCGGEGEEMCDACDAFSLISRGLVYLISLIGIILTVVIMWSGIKIATSAGNMSAVSEAKNLLWNAIIGFVIILVAWLAIDTVMKTLLRDNLFDFNQDGQFGPWNVIDPSSCVRPETIPVQGGGPGGNNGNPVASTTPPTAGCSGCASLPSSIPRKQGIACGNRCQIHPELGADLLDMVGNPSGWQLTESWPPSGYRPGDPSGLHKALCHGDATCVDVGFTDRDYSDPRRIQAFIASASSRGLTAVFETNSRSRAEAYRAQGIPAVYVAHATADHFSVYSCSLGLAQQANACRR
jgi:hypothetical protein